MKHKLFYILTISYFVLAALGFLAVSTYTTYYSNEYVISQSAKDMYRIATRISSTYATNYFEDDSTLMQIQEELAVIDDYLSADIWIINLKGEVLVNSNGNDNSIAIPQMSISSFGNKYYQIGTFYDHFSEDQLTVFSQITMDYKVYGYVMIHKPLSTISNYNNGLIHYSYMTLLLWIGLATVIYLLLLFLIYRPIIKISKTAKEYVDGNFNHPPPVSGDDELGYIAASLHFMANELNTLEEDQKKFISNVSHDFRSPLTSIKGYIEAMMDGTIPPELQPKYFKIIVFETERLTKLTSSILELNKYGSHGVMLDISSFDINQVIKNTALTFEGACAEKHISFDIILSGSELFVQADITKIQQVIYNLIDNAIKFSNDNSTITLETTEKNEKIFVSVKDSGIGIPKESLNKIWDRFYKTDLSRGKDKRGTGLGLAIVKEIISAHNENINVISTEGVGTEFIFTLPSADDTST